MTATAQATGTAETATTQPTMRITDITVHPQYRRRDIGRLRELQHSIRANGLLRPVPVTTDGMLIAGERRLRACRNLGWDRIPVIIARNDDHAVELLAAEQADVEPHGKPQSATELTLIGLYAEDFNRTGSELRRAAGRRHQLVAEGWRRSQEVAADTAGMPGHYYQQIKPIAMAWLGYEGARSGHGRTPVDAEWSRRSREALDLMDRVWVGDRIEHVGPTGRRARLTVNAIYETWMADRKRRRESAGEGIENNSEPNSAAAAAPGAQRAQREALAKGIATLTGLCHGLASITDIDPAITREEAAAYNRDLSNASRVLRGLHQKIKEYVNGID